ncbi:hypothetical protein ACP8HZ_05825 [Francisella noatunensis]
MRDIKKVVTGVTACQALIDQAVKENAEMLLLYIMVIFGKVKVTLS